MFHISPNVLVYILALPDNLYRLLWINSEKRLLLLLTNFCQRLPIENNSFIFAAKKEYINPEYVPHIPRRFSLYISPS